MGILTDISVQYDDDQEVQRIYAVTKFGINNRTQLNRVAGRAAVGEGVGQRSLVSAAYAEEGIDLVWREGPFTTLKPEEKYPQAKEINYKSYEIDQLSELGDIAGMVKRDYLPGWLLDKIEFGEFREGNTLHIWEIPYHIIGR